MTYPNSVCFCLCLLQVHGVIDNMAVSMPECTVIPESLKKGRQELKTQLNG